MASERGLVVDTFDLSAFGVAKARRLAQERGVAINAFQADALQWDWPEARYDLVALIYVHLPKRERRLVHAKALKALKPGGLIVLEAFRPEQIERQAAGTRGGPRDAALLYSVEALAKDFAGEEILLLEAAEARAGRGPPSRRRECGRAGGGAETLTSGRGARRERRGGRFRPVRRVFRDDRIVRSRRSNRAPSVNPDNGRQALTRPA